MAPDHWLHQSERRLQALLCEPYGKTLAKHGQPKHPRWLCTAHATAHAGTPAHVEKPRRIFVNSMSDLFHPERPLDYIKRVFAVMRQADWHQFQALTKRSERLLKCDGELAWAPNIWMGVSVENEEHMRRIEDLRGTSAHLRFLSLEPLLGPLPNLNLTGMHWVIVGGESRPNAPRMQPHMLAQLSAESAWFEIKCKRCGLIYPSAS